jgi:hypothetical protein
MAEYIKLDGIGALCTIVLQIQVTLRLTVSQAWCRAPFGAHDQNLTIILI